MKTPEQQLFNYIDKQIIKHKDKYTDGNQNYYLEWVELKEHLLRNEDIIYSLHRQIIKYKNILEYIKEHFNITINEDRF